MTREEAHRIAYEDLDSMYHSTWIKVVVDDIYDDFKSRTCENCKWLKERNPFNKPIFPRHKCTHADVIYMCTDKDFGCNKFERNTNETNN